MARVRSTKKPTYTQVLTYNDIRKRAWLMNIKKSTPMMFVGTNIKRRQRRKRHNNNTHLFDPFTFDAQPIASTGMPNFVLVRKSKRHSYYVNVEQLMYYIPQYFASGHFTIKKNPRNASKHNDFTTHSWYKFRIFMKTDLYYGPNSDNVKRMQIVDILGIHMKEDTCNIFQRYNAGIVTWIKSVIAVKKKTHYPCIDKTCPGIFPVTNKYDGKLYTCDICNIKQCPNCQSEGNGHGALSCNDYQIKQKCVELTDAYVLTGLMEGRIQPCPSCNAMTERIDGCNSIRCTNIRCRDCWCWACGEANMQTKYNHNIHDHYLHHTSSMKNRGLKQCPSTFDSEHDGDYYANCKARVVARNQRLFGKHLDAYALRCNSTKPFTPAELISAKIKFVKLDTAIAEYKADVNTAMQEFNNYTLEIAIASEDVTAFLYPFLTKRRKQYKNLLLGNIQYESNRETIINLIRQLEHIAMRIKNSNETASTQSDIALAADVNRVVNNINNTDIVAVVNALIFNAKNQIETEDEIIDITHIVYDASVADIDATTDIENAIIQNTANYRVEKHMGAIVNRDAAAVLTAVTDDEKASTTAAAKISGINLANAKSNSLHSNVNVNDYVSLVYNTHEKYIKLMSDVLERINTSSIGVAFASTFAALSEIDCYNLVKKATANAAAAIDRINTASTTKELSAAIVTIHEVATTDALKTMSSVCNMVIALDRGIIATESTKYNQRLIDIHAKSDKIITDGHTRVKLIKNTAIDVAFYAAVEARDDNINEYIATALLASSAEVTFATDILVYIKEASNALLETLIDMTKTPETKTPETKTPEFTIKKTLDNLQHEAVRQQLILLNMVVDALSLQVAQPHIDQFISVMTVREQIVNKINNLRRENEIVDTWDSGSARLTREAYAMAKKHPIKHSEEHLRHMLSNNYRGPNDNRNRHRNLNRNRDDSDSDSDFDSDGVEYSDGDGVDDSDGD